MSDHSFSFGVVGLDFPEHSLDSLFRFAAENGLSFIDLYNRVNFVDFDVESIRSFVDKYGVAVNSISSRAMPNAATLSTSNEVELALESLEQAARLGVGLSESMVGASNIDVSTDEAIEEYLHKASPILDRADRLGVTVVVENVFNRDGGHDVTATIDGTVRLMEAAGGRLGLCWDTGNYIVDGSDPASVTETMDRVLPWTKMIQIKDVTQVQEPDTGTGLETTRLMRDTHNGVWRSVPLGQGEARIDDVLAELSRREWAGPVSLEMFTSPARFEAYWAASRDWLSAKMTLG